MKLELECTWNNKKNKAKQRIHFDYLPKSIFGLPVEKILLTQKLVHDAKTSGPAVLKEIHDLVEEHPKSLYLSFNYFKTLQFFEYLDEADALFAKMKKLFPGEVFIKCIIGESLLINKDYENFSEVFNQIEVLKGAFLKRKDFYFEEALFFHHLWGRYFFETGNELQADKHKRLILLIMNTLQNCQIMNSSES